MREEYQDDSYVGGGGRGLQGSQSQSLSEPSVDPKFSFTGAEVNLKYDKFLPFIGAYLVYKFLWKKI